MKNFTKFYNKVDAIANSKKPVKDITPSKGLASRSTPTMKQEDMGNTDIYNEVAKYITAIRKQKQELMNGRS
ncbi:MAG: hypothetical protein EBU33_10455 [Sphingobacteriia bacterium]|nr:hypothetical protein [Sphingobacteriia bacterium]